jgi:hypothetical protein
VSTSTVSQPVLLHVVPPEPFNHDVDLAASCVCGPTLCLDTDAEGKEFAYWRHMPLFTSELPPVRWDWSGPEPVPYIESTPPGGLELGEPQPRLA